MLWVTDLMRIPALLIAATLCWSLSACDSGSSEKKPDAKADAKATEDAEKQKRVDERRKKREADAKAAKDAEDAKAAAIEALLTIPETLPKDLGKACAAVGDAQDAFVKRLFDAEAAAKAASAKGMAVKTCNQTGSIEVAVCQKRALDGAPAELKKELPALLRGCIEKFGTPPKGAEPPK